MKRIMVIALTLVLCASASFVHVAAQPTLGVYFDQVGTQRTAVGVVPLQQVFCYIVASGIGSEGVQAFEFRVRFPGLQEGQILVDWALPSGGANVGVPPDFVVGLASCLPGEAVWLVRCDIIFFTAPSDLVISLEPTSFPSIPGTPAYVTCIAPDDIRPFRCWQSGGGGEAIINPVTLTPSVCPSEGYPKTIVTTDPAGLGVVVDGSPHVAPAVFYWEPGSSHEIGVSSPQGLGGVVYEYASWSDGGDMTHGIIAPESDAAYTAVFNRISREVTVDTDPTGLSVVVDGSPYVAPAVFYWEPGSSHEIGVSSPQGLGGVVYEYASWSDGGDMTHGIIAPEDDATYTAHFTPVGDCDQPMLSLLMYQGVSWVDPLWTVQVQVRNAGPGVAKNVNVTMNEDLAWLTISDPNCSYGDIAAGASSWGNDSYTFDLTNHPGGSFNIWFDVTYEDACGNHYSLRLDPEFEPGVNGEAPDALSTYRLSQNYPNPFNPNTTISFLLQVPGHVSLQIFDASGKLVRTLVDEFKTQGLHASDWNGRDSNGVTVTSGVYLYRMQAGSFVETKKMVLLR